MYVLTPSFFILFHHHNDHTLPHPKKERSAQIANMAKTHAWPKKRARNREADGGHTYLAFCHTFIL